MAVFAISNTVPLPYVPVPPSPEVVPNKSPLASMISVPYGAEPFTLLPPKLASTVALVAKPVAVFAISNTAPLPVAPPAAVTPNRSPFASATRPAWGLAPLVLLKLSSVVARWHSRWRCS